ncbi:hypothetical protein Tco_0470038, partial [Tanacetum coccineum]
SEPLSVTGLTGTEGTSAVVAILTGTTKALSITFASTSVVRPIFTDDYEIVDVDGWKRISEKRTRKNGPKPSTEWKSVKRQSQNRSQRPKSQSQ